ncbi:hypothetical protein V491_06659 [Pseudogymnoascus sp. VKM F-3775]|nr:hypothetical protein V491_06659 [Pseudogymnoascus sp. VKM F-3775]
MEPDRQTQDRGTSDDTPRAALVNSLAKDEKQPEYEPESMKLWTIMLGLYLSVFLVALVNDKSENLKRRTQADITFQDRTIISTAIPQITNQFGSIQDIGWYGSSYMLTAASSSLVFGRVYKFYSTKWVFLGSMVVFEVGSALCGAAPNSISLIVGRAIAGLGSSGIFTGGMMIIVQLIPLHKRPIYYSIVGAVFGFSSIIGPLLGGAFTDRSTWRWCFYINLPIGALAMLAMVLLLRTETTNEEPVTLSAINRLDPIGTLCFVPSIVCLVLALEWGGTTYPWSNPKVIGLLVTSIVLFIAFCIVQVIKPDTATVPVRIITQRSIISGVLYMLMITGSMMVIIYFLPIWFQAVKGSSAIHSGISTIPVVLSLVLFSILSGGFTQRIGYYVPSMILSPILAATGAGFMTTFTLSTSHPSWIGFQCLYGFGIGTALQTSSLAAQTVLHRNDISTGMALMFFGQQLGGAIFVAVAQNVFTSGLLYKLTGIPGLDPEMILHAGTTALRTVVPAQDLSIVVDAFNYSITRTFFVAVGLSAGTLPAALIMEWNDIREKGENGKQGSGVNVEAAEVHDAKV